MKQTVLIMLTVFLCFAAETAGAQQMSLEPGQQQTEATRDTAKKKKVFYPVVLGLSDRTGGAISKQLFDSLLRQGVKSQDPAGQVTGFIFNYMERNLYEDSIGNIMVLTDLLTEYCPGDTLTPAVSSTIYLRTKRGDTAYFDNIRMILPEKGEVSGKGMKFVIE
jgi:hypothetical protein